MVPEIFVNFSFPPPAIFLQVLSRLKVFRAIQVISSALVWKPLMLCGSLEYIEPRMGRRGYPRRWAFRKRASISQATTSSSGFHYLYNSIYLHEFFFDQSYPSTVVGTDVMDPGSTALATNSQCFHHRTLHSVWVSFGWIKRTGYQ